MQLFISFSTNIFGKYFALTCTVGFFIYNFFCIMYMILMNGSDLIFFLQPLDRDPPNGFEIWQVLIAANDEDGSGPTSLRTLTEVVITLTDINDNAPFLNMVR